MTSFEYEDYVEPGIELLRQLQSASTAPPQQHPFSQATILRDVRNMALDLACMVRENASTMPELSKATLISHIVCMLDGIIYDEYQEATHDADCFAILAQIIAYDSENPEGEPNVIPGNVIPGDGLQVQGAPANAYVG